LGIHYTVCKLILKSFAKILFLSILLGFSAKAIVAQEKAKANPFDMLDTASVCFSDELFVFAELMPSYRGGLNELEVILNERLDLSRTTDGTVYLSITVNCRSELTGVKLLRGMDDETNMALINLIRSLTDWTAALQNKKPVDCLLILPFRIQKGEVSIPKR
jgi:hypothetical protein